MRKQIHIEFKKDKQGKIYGVTDEGHKSVFDLQHWDTYRFYDGMKAPARHSMPESVLNEFETANYSEYQYLLQSIVTIHNKIDFVLLTHETINVHRQPTAGEIRFGYGATHYAELNLVDFINMKTGKLKKWTKSNFDGLRYYRGA